MSETDFVAIGVVGGLLSLAQQWINKKWDLTSPLNRGLIILLSLIVGIVYIVLRQTVWWTTILGVLASASAFYAIFLKKPDVV